MVGYIIAQTATLAYLRLKTKNVFPSLRDSFTAGLKFTGGDRKIIRSEVIYGCAILVLLSGITILYSSDSIIIRLFFSPDEAGMYSAVSAIARIVFFVTASVAKLKDSH
ncbi:hypothetical protein D3C86_1449750 [compost metagenome]